VKQPRYRNPAVLFEARMFPCQYCGADDATIVAAHSNWPEHGKGMSIKAHDCFVAYLCSGCHALVDSSAASAKVRRALWDAAHKRSVRLFAHLLDERGISLLRAAG
jgi:hypothetical protein